MNVKQSEIHKNGYIMKSETIWYPRNVKCLLISFENNLYKSGSNVAQAYIIKINFYYKLLKVCRSSETIFIVIKTFESTFKHISTQYTNCFNSL